MATPLRKLRDIGLFSVLGAAAALPAYADDTEIYTGLNNLSATVDPNVMFVIDTSGSMNARESLAIAQYDPSITYPGSCTNSRIYWSTTGQAPTCSTSRFFNASQFRCNAAQTPLFNTTTGTGIYQDRLARYSSGSFFSGPSWRTLSTSTQNPPHVECKGDEGVHGETASSTAVFIQDNAQPYTTNANNKRNWANTGSFYTLFSANYVNYFNDSGNIVNPRRIDIVKDVVKDLVDSNTNLNISLMRFDRNAHGGPIIFPFSDIDATNVRTNFKAAVDGLSAAGNTPLSETMSEALRVYRGDAAVFGLSPPANSSTVSVASSFSSGTTYDSPMDVQCQKNFIVFLSDGTPTSDSEANSFTNTELSGLTLPSGDTSCGSGGDNCLDELAEILNETDLVPGLAGKQNVVTYTIGFGSTAAGSASLNALLQETGTKGGGEAFIAQDFRQLSNVFTQIITEIQAVNTTFTAPAVSVNAFNRVTNREELFFTLFKPQQESIWTGNLKRFRLGQKLDASGQPADTDGDGVPDLPTVLDSQGNLAVSEQTGFFDTNATSFWTTAGDSPDGDETAKGGAARLFGGGDIATAQTRKIYTNFSGEDLTATANAVVPTNNNLTNTLLGLTGATGEPTRTELLQWLSGIDIKDEDSDGSSTDPRRVMGDPLHTKPILLEYAPAPTPANPNPASDITVYMTTNEGLLHAIDSDTGQEVFSVIPKQQLARAATYFANPATGFKDYGIDGPLASFFDDANGDGFLDPATDKYLLIFGERRGGNRYYAIDVTNRNQPKFKWTIVGGTGDFTELGQTWSLPLARKVRINGSEKNVLVFGAGYSISHDLADTARNATGDNVGRGIFMVDVTDGSLVWQAGPSTSTTANLKIAEMKYAMPSDLSALDLNGDGFLNRIYAPDMGGQMFRIDFHNETCDAAAGINPPLCNTSAATLATGALFADLQKPATGNPGASANRRFFFPPDVAFFSDGVDVPFFSLAIGSGYRAHPLNTTVADRFYLLQDTNPFTVPLNTAGDAVSYPTAISEATLDDLTNPVTSRLSDNGWFIRLVNSSGTNVGEKVLSSAVTIAGTVLFTTFSPVAGASAGSCAPNQGVGTVFGVSAVDATPTELFETVPGGSGSSDPRVVTVLTRTGIPPEVTILFPPTNPASPVGLVAAESLDLDFANTPVETYWYEQETQ